MKSYSRVSMFVNGKETAFLEIFKEHNIFQAFEHDSNVFSGSYSGVVAFIEKWQANKKDLVAFMENAGMNVEYVNPFE